MPRQLVPETTGQTQNPPHPSAAAALGTLALSQGHVGEHAIDEVGGALRHSSTTPTRTDRAILARAIASSRSLVLSADQPVEAASVAAKPREPAGEPATPQKVPELLLDEAGQSLAVAQVGSLRAKRLEVIVLSCQRAIGRIWPKSMEWVRRGRSFRALACSVGRRSS
jgi:hypothetical protein